LTAAPTVEHRETRRVAWVDTDAGGRIHFTAAFRWAEAAETALLRRLGMIDNWGSYPRRKVEAEYLEVLRFEDEIEVAIRPERVGRTSVTWSWEIEHDGRPFVTGRHTVVHVDGDGRPAALPDRVREGLLGG
jgi:YbgC/YbaW family acyl-CoA thioester hydrolase